MTLISQIVGLQSVSRRPQHVVKKCLPITKSHLYSPVWVNHVSIHNRTVEECKRKLSYFVSKCKVKVKIIFYVTSPTLHGLILLLLISFLNLGCHLTPIKLMLVSLVCSIAVSPYLHGNSNRMLVARECERACDFVSFAPVAQCVNL